jgi:hypothetical protein
VYAILGVFGVKSPSDYQSIRNNLTQDIDLQDINYDFEYSNDSW